MLEVFGRLGLAVVLALLAFAFDAPKWEVAWRVLPLFGAYTVLAYLLERRGLRNSGVAGFIAIADATAIALLLAAHQLHGTLGMLAILPLLYAARAFDANPLLMAAPAAASLLLADGILGSGRASPQLFGHTLGILLVGALVRRPEPAYELTEESVAEEEETPVAPFQPDLMLRERYRQARDAYRELEHRTRVDRFAAELWEASGECGRGFHSALAKLLARHCGASKVVLHVLEPAERAMVVSAHYGALPRKAKDSAQRVDLTLAREQLRERLQGAVGATLAEADRASMATCVLTHAGKTVGMVTAVSDGAGNQAQIGLDEVASLVGEALHRERFWRGEKAKASQLQILYDLQTATHGAQDRVALASRVLDELSQIVMCDEACLLQFEDGEPVLLAGTAQPSQLFEHMSFAAGAGFTGWIETGAPELWLPDAGEDSRVPPEEAVRRRIGSLVAVSVGAPHAPRGVILLSTHRTYGFSAQAVDSVRLVALELGRLFDAEGAKAQVPFGLVKPEEFRLRVQEGRRGHIVHLEVIKWESYGDDCGEDELRRALRQLARRLVKTLPSGGLLCVGKVGMAAYLPDSPANEVAQWAAEATSTAPLVAVRKAQGGQRPLAMRSRTAALAPRPEPAVR